MSLLQQKDRTEAVFLDTLEAPEEKPVDALSKKQQKEKERVKIEKSLRNKQNRLKNKAAKGGADGNKGDGKSFKKRKFSARSTGDDSNDSSLSIYGPGNSSSGGSSGKRKYSDEPPAKQQKHSNHTTAAAAVPVVPAEKLEKFVASGKDWKEVRLCYLCSYSLF